MSTRIPYKKKKELIVDHIRQNRKNEWTSPTEIGSLFGGHSAIGSPLCLRMTDEGILERNERGHYRIKHENEMEEHC